MAFDVFTNKKKNIKFGNSLIRENRLQGTVSINTQRLLPIIFKGFIVAVLGVAIVLVGMLNAQFKKEINIVEKEIKFIEIQQVELSANIAELESPLRIQTIAKELGLNHPTSEQIMYVKDKNLAVQDNLALNPNINK